MSDIKKNIVILGAGFGGLRASTDIAGEIQRLGLRKKYEVVLIDRHPYHTYTPTLYEAATTSKETANYCDLKQIVTFRVEEAVRGQPITFINENVSRLDLIEGDIHFDSQKLKFDYLVLALGSETNYFNIPGLRENALPFKTFMDAIVLRDKIIELYLSKPEIHIVIGGAGSTGVEFAGELQEWLCELGEELKNACKANTSIIGAPPVVLPGFLPKISELAEKRLRHLGVNILTSEKVASAAKEKILLESGKEISYDIFIWTGGVKASALMGTLPLKSDAGKVIPSGEMECLPQTEDLNLYGKIYGLGDAVCVYDKKTGKPVPLVAHAAIEQAKVVAKNIIVDIKKENGLAAKSRHASFIYQEYPYVIPIGGKYAIAKIGSRVISGWPAWVFKIFIELYYLLSILPIWKALKIWLKGIKIYIQNDRLG
jgi:NADH dehydrogenase